MTRARTIDRLVPYTQAMTAVAMLLLIATVLLLEHRIVLLEHRIARLECAVAQGGYGQQSSVGPITIRHGKTTGRTSPTVTGCK